MKKEFINGLGIGAIMVALFLIFRAIISSQLTHQREQVKAEIFSKFSCWKRPKDGEYCIHSVEGGQETRYCFPLRKELNAKVKETKL